MQENSRALVAFDPQRKYEWSTRLIARFDNYLSSPDATIPSIPLDTKQSLTTLTHNAALTGRLKEKWSRKFPLIRSALLERNRRLFPEVSEQVVLPAAEQIEVLAPIIQQVRDLAPFLPSRIVKTMEAKHELLVEKTRREKEKKQEQLRLRRIADFYSRSALIDMPYKTGKLTRQVVMLPDGSFIGSVTPTSQLFAIELGKTMITGEMSPTRRQIIQATQPQYADPSEPIPVDVSARAGKGSEQTTLLYFRQRDYPIEVTGEGLERAYKIGLRPGTKLTAEIRAALLSPIGEYSQDNLIKVKTQDYREVAVKQIGARLYEVTAPNGSKAVVYSAVSADALADILSTIISQKPISVGDMMDRIGIDSLHTFSDNRRAAVAQAINLGYSIKINNFGRGRETTFEVKEAGSNGHLPESAGLVTRQAETTPLDQLLLNEQQAQALAAMLHARREVLIVSPNGSRINLDLDAKTRQDICSLTLPNGSLENLTSLERQTLRAETVHRIRMLLHRTDAKDIISSNYKDPRIRDLLLTLHSLYGSLGDNLSRFLMEEPRTIKVINSQTQEALTVSQEWYVPAGRNI